MKCEEAGALLSEYLDNQLEVGTRRELVNHLGSCPDCSRDEAELAATMRLLHRFARESRADSR